MRIMLVDETLPEISYAAFRHL